MSTRTPSRSEAAYAELRFVYNVQTKLLDLYNEMAGPDAVYMKETDFERDIRQCLTYFYYEKKRHEWVCRNIEDEAALTIMKRDVRPILKRHAGGGTSKEQYAAKVQGDFDHLWRYVREWLDANSGGGAREDRMAALLDKMRTLIEDYEREVHDTA